MPEESRSERVAFANTLRGVAVICVLVQHYFVGFWAVPDTIGTLLNVPALDVAVSPALTWVAPPSPLSLGAFGVALFFLVSGFVIPHSLARLSAERFLIGRLFRIFPLYAAGFTITLLSLWAVGSYFSTTRSLSVAQIALHYLPGLRDISLTPSLDAVVWTLDIEVKFYLLCALGASLFRARDPRALLLVLAAALASITASLLLAGLPAMSAAAMVASVLSKDLAYIVFMFIGTAIYFMHIGKLARNAGVALVLALAIAFPVLLLIGPDPVAALNACNYALAVVVFALAWTFQKLPGTNRLTEFFAVISYPLYAAHAVFGWAILRVLWDIGVPVWLSLLVTCSLAVALAWLLHATIEIPTQRFGRKLGQQLRRDPAVVAG